MRIFITLTVLIMSCSLAYAAQEIQRLSLDDPAGLGLIIEKDPAVKVEGQSSIKIATKLPTTVNLGEISPLEVDNSKLVFQAKVKTEQLEGTAFLEMWCVIGGKQYFSRGSGITGSTDWTTLETPFLLKLGEKPEKIILNLVINGQGKVWVDDVLVTKDAFQPAQ